MDLRETIQQLADLTGPSGFEQPVAKRVQTLLEPYMDEVMVDTMGNVAAIKYCGRPGAKRLLFDAHMDEIGLIVTRIEKGFLRFATLGGVDPRMLPAADVTVLTNPPLPGVITCLPPHILKGADMDKTIPMEDLLIDVGLTEEEAKARIPLGTPVSFASRCMPFGSGLCGKSLDNRACLGIVLKALDLLGNTPLQVDLCILASTQEEVGLRGAKTGVYGIQPDYCVVVDTTHGKTPDAPAEKTLAFGGGAAIGVGPNMNHDITQRLIDLAKQKQIPYQIEVMAGNTGTNGWVIQTSGNGISTAVLSLPLKYMHTPVEVIDDGDATAISQLLAALALSMGEEGLR